MHYDLLSHSYETKAKEMRLEPNEYLKMLSGAYLDYPVMQFTGLLDKNGKEIYEGDIVRTQWGGEGFIQFIDGAFHFMFEDGKARVLVSEHEAGKREIEVIGNIHENPDLIESGSGAKQKEA
jgi:uncharacterized phage protein (TIGR01671 family)